MGRYPSTNTTRVPVHAAALELLAGLGLVLAGLIALACLTVVFALTWPVYRLVRWIGW